MLTSALWNELGKSGDLDSFSGYLLSTYSVPATVLDARETAVVEKEGKIFTFSELTFYWKTMNGQGDGWTYAMVPSLCSTLTLLDDLGYVTSPQ